jgi:hypothetical protein
VAQEREHRTTPTPTRKAHCYDQAPTLDGYLTKWRTFLHSERELEMDSLDFLSVMSQMVDELQAAVAR